MSGMRLSQPVCFRLFLAIAALVLTGCAGQVNMLPTLQQGVIPDPQQGVVVARIINASGNALPFNQLTINPENLHESKSIKPERLLAIRPKLNGTTVFASIAKPGNYSLSSIRAFYSNGNGWYSRFAGANEKFGTFQVREGGITDLGTIIYYPKPQEDKYTDLLVRVPESAIGETLEKHFPFYPFQPQELLTWRDDENNEAHESAYFSLAQNPLAYSSGYLAPDGAMYFLGKVGVMIKRTSEGLWELDGVDTDHELRAIAQNKRGDLVVGGSEGVLFVKQQGEDWIDISLGHEYQVEELQLSDTGRLDVLAAAQYELKVLRGQLGSEKVSWATINSFSTAPGKGWKHYEQGRIVPIEKLSKKQRYLYGTSLFSIHDQHYATVRTQSTLGDAVFAVIDSDIYHYDPETWEIKGAVSDLGLTTVIGAGSVQLGLKKAGFWSWTGRPTYYRIDEAGNREEIVTYFEECSETAKTGTKPCKKQHFSFRSVPWFTSETDAVAIVSFTRSAFLVADRKTEVLLLVTDDGGKSWTVTENKPPKEYCTSLVPQITDRLLVSCNGASGDFYESVDSGENWVQVRQQGNF